MERTDSRDVIGDIGERLRERDVIGLLEERDRSEFARGLGFVS
jgi:hypothetical protein